MRFRLNRRRIGPFVLNLSSNELGKGKSPVNSISLNPASGFLNFRLWSKDGTRGLTSIDTPGQGSISVPSRNRRQRKAARSRRTAQRQARQQPAPLSHNPNTVQHAPLSYDPNQG